MIPEYIELLYQKLLFELERIQSLQLPEDKILEQCFVMCTFQEDKLVRWVSPFIFEKQEDEIHFFKTIRPKFSSHLHYLKCRYKAVLFQPTVPKEQTAFFEYELDKAERFFTENAGFYQYYKSGQTNNDHIYFTRSCIEDAGPTHPCRSETGYDLLIGTFQGLEMYKEFAHSEIEKLRISKGE
jgi:RteC protein